MTSSVGAAAGRRPGSFRARLAGRFAALMTVVFTLGALAAVALLRQALVGQLDATLLRLGAIEAATLLDAPADQMRFHEGVFDPPMGEGRELARLVRYAQIWGLDGRSVLRSRSLGPRDLPLAPGALTAAARDDVVTTGTAWKAGALRTVYLPLARLGPGHERHVLQVAAPLAPVYEVLRAMAWALAGLGAAATALTLVGGWALAGRAIRPAREVAEQAEAITAGSLGARIHAEADAVEYDRLVAVLNAMLARLEAAFEAQRRFVADASHEIRHPLAALRAGLELALRRERSAADYRAALAEGVAQVDRVTDLATGLLLLARSDAGVLQPRRVPTDVRTLAAAACRRASLVGEVRGVRVVCGTVPDGSVARSALVGVGAGDMVAVVDPTLVGRALDNLLDNAVRASPDAGTVRVQVTRDADAVLVQVADDGPGVAPAHRARLFERFFRADPARASDGGAGLGLAIVKGIAEAHGGTVAYTPGGQRGSVFVLRLPAVSVPTCLKPTQDGARDVA